jgi:3-hydroxy-9,10-secoandrosta-1,3,5(10)-triene-9,17-dione monooxygenase reductase component
VSDTPTAIDPSHFRTVLGHFCSGITVITAMDEGTPVGMTCQSFASVSLDPPMVLFVPGKTSASWARIRGAGHFCANVLGEEQEDLSRVFASKVDDKFAGIGWRPGASGAPILEGVLASIDCTVEHVYEGGDHDIVVGRVLELDGAAGGPLLFFRGGYGRLGL